MMIPAATVVLMLKATLAMCPTSVYARTTAGYFAKPGVCYAEAKTAGGEKPVKTGGKIRAPKKIRNVWPKFPELPPGTTVRGVWMGEALVDAEGNVVRVWTTREIEISPPFPAFNKSIVDALRQSKFTPLTINGQPRPFCVTVTTNINWQ